jgi:glycosyltransferase involved in cell wall biosynthesis
MVLISIVIPVYNREFELKRAITSVLNQTEQNIEIIVVDDCSTIDIKKVTADFSDSRILYHRLPVKGNGNVCRNLGVLNAKGKFIAMLDSDDEWLPEHLNRKVKFIEENNVDGVFGSFMLDDGLTKINSFSRPFNKEESMANYLLLGGIAQTSTHFYKATCAKAILWDETLFRNQDLDYSIRFSQAYRFLPSTDLTCIVHWKKGDQRNENFQSNIKFIEKHKESLSPQAYHSFHANLYLKIANRADVDANLKQHFLNESTKFINFCSMADYMTTHGLNKGKLKKVFLRFNYAFRVLFS